MDLAIAQPGVTQQTLRTLTACCTYLKVETVADISTASGTHIQSQVLHGSPPNSFSTLNWQPQPKPGPPAWQIRRKFISTITHKATQLNTSLGNWHNTSHRVYSGVISQNNSLIQITNIATKQQKFYHLAFCCVSPHHSSFTSTPVDVIAHSALCCTVTPLLLLVYPTTNNDQP